MDWAGPLEQSRSVQRHSVHIVIAGARLLHREASIQYTSVVDPDSELFPDPELFVRVQQ